MLAALAPAEPRDGLTTELDRFSVPQTPSSSIVSRRRRHRPLPARPEGVMGRRAARPSGRKLVQSVYDRIIVNDKEVVEVELTEDAKRHGLALAMPETVRVAMARPAGARRRQTTIVRVPIRGKAEWLGATRERSAS